MFAAKETRIWWDHNVGARQRDARDYVRVTCLLCGRAWDVAAGDVRAQRPLWPILRPWRAELIEMGLWSPPARARKAAS